MIAAVALVGGAKKRLDAAVRDGAVTERHHGRIEVGDSQLGGASFSLFLPAA